MKHLSLTILAIIFSVCSFAQIGPIYGTTYVCTGSFAQLSNNTPGGTWTSANLGVASINITTGVYYGTGAGSTTITYSTISGMATVTVSVGTSPGPINGPTSVCVGNTIALTNTTPGGIWTTSNTFVAGASTSTGIVTGLSSGSAIVSYIVSGSCNATLPITVVSTICSSTSTVVPTTIRGGCSTDTFEVPFYCGATYQWQSSTDLITWTNVGSSGTYNNIYIYTPATSGYFRCVITCVSGGLVVNTIPSFLDVSGVTLQSTINTTPSTTCPALEINTGICAAIGTYSVTTYFGDGTSSITPITVSSLSNSSTISHYYEMPGTYTIKQILYTSGSSLAVDSTILSYNYTYCHMLPVSFYIDNNSNCIKDAGEIISTVPIKVQIDSNGVILDTITVTSGFYYYARGIAGTGYGFKIVSSDLFPTCIPGGVIRDTILPYVNTYPVQSIGLSCAGTPGFDFVETATILCGRHMAQGKVVINNLYCSPTSGTLTVNFSPKYIFMSANPAPASTTATSMTWNLGAMSYLGGTQTITFYLDRPGAWLLPGDTINTNYTVSPTTGDANPANNFIARVDTVKVSYDPNYIESDPAGHILHGAQMQYTVHFENTGNDTAHNIHVMDTLDANLLPGTMEIVAASDLMYATVINDGTYNIVKFDFPNIMLPDSSHHGFADGFVTYKINSKSGLAAGTPIFNQGGIFFDDNEVVMTNVIESDVAYINGPSSVCLGGNITLTELAQGGTWTSSSPNATVSASGVVTGVSTGSAVISYTRVYGNGPITVTKAITVTAGGSAGTILGATGVCVGATTALTNNTAGGAWGVSNGSATMLGNVVTGVTPGTDTISYYITVSGCTNMSQHIITVSPMPNAGSISGAPAVCTGNSITLTATAPGGVWTAFNGNASVSGGVVTGLTNGADTIYYTVTNVCGTATTKHVITVSPAPNAGTISGTDTVCLGSSVIFTESVTGGLWSMFAGNVSVGGGVVTGLFGGLDSVYYTVTNSCGSKKTSKAIFVKVCPTSVLPVAADNSLIIYPNPTSGQLTIIIENGAYTSFTITNVAGQEMMQQQFNAAQTDLQIGKFPQGVYYITLKGDHGNVVKKIVKM